MIPRGLTFRDQQATNLTSVRVCFCPVNAIIALIVAIERAFFRPPRGHFFLFGPRGTGKSTWLEAAFPQAVRVDLLAPAQQRRYAARPERLRVDRLLRIGRHPLVLAHAGR